MGDTNINYRDWIGRTREVSAWLDPWPAQALGAVLDLPMAGQSQPMAGQSQPVAGQGRPGQGEPAAGQSQPVAGQGGPVPVQSVSGQIPLEAGQDLPSLWHWLYFLEAAPRGRIGADGHPQRGGFLPPVSLPRRMFAGARTRYLQPLKLGQPAQMVERVEDVQVKRGSRGEMVVVTVQHDYQQGGAACVSEQRDFIYLPAPPDASGAGASPNGASTSAKSAGASPNGADASPNSANTSTNSANPPAGELAPVPDSAWRLDLPTDPVLLFRFSALTFNSHRIHYDADYARQAEGYPALVVHGPLSAMLLSECVRIHAGRPLREFAFRARSPLFCGQTIRVRGFPEGDGGKVTAYNPAGEAAVTATFELA